MKHWIAAARLRTLPLALSSIILGTCLAVSYGQFNPLIFILCLFTTLFYQVLSNYANDLGDGIRGTDNNRIGEARAVASGVISAESMKRAVFILAILSFISGTWLSIVATRNLPFVVTLTFILLGTLAIAAAIKYTVGKKAYGYAGLGDLAVLIFFGFVGVTGSFFLQTNFLNWEVFLPAASVGLLSMGVLNINNLRDIETDKLNGKNTLAVMLGMKGAKIYHGILIILAFDLAFMYNIFIEGDIWQNLYFISLPLLLLNILAVVKANRAEDFEPLLKMLAIATLIFSLTFGVGQIYGT